MHPSCARSAGCTAEPCASLPPATSDSTTRKGMEEKVEVALARFDRAVKESSIRSDQIGQEKGRTQLLAEKPEDIASRIAVEARGGRPSDEATVTCRPWDYESFTSRLRTFSPLNWFAKPPFASPPMCARYGWINRGRDTLFCQCCSAKLQFAEHKEADGDASIGGNSDSRPAVFLGRLQSQHHDLCPWNGNACPKEFLQLPPRATEDLCTEFLARLDSLVPLAESKSMPEVSLPSDFEQHCPGGLSTLATKAMAIMAAHRRSTPKAARTLLLLVDEEPTGEEPSERCSERAGANVGGKKRLRDGGSAGGVVRGSGGMSAFEDEVVGSAAAIALFGWRSASPTAGSPSNGDAEGAAGSEMPPPQRLQCALCSRRLVTDNFLAADLGPGASPAQSSGSPSEGLYLDSSAGGGACSRGKRRRLSGGGTPLKAMDIAAEHRSFCPWATVHPAVEGEEPAEGAVPGWRQSLDAVLSWADSEQASSKPHEGEGFGDAATDKAEEAFQKVQKVLGVLMRC